MATSPTFCDDSMVEVSIKVNGTELSCINDCIMVNVYFCANRLPRAEIHLADGDIASGEYPNIESSDIKPGADIKVLVGSESDKSTIFEGIIAEIGLHISRVSSVAIIECTDKAASLSIVKTSQTFLQQKDSDIITSLISGGSKAKSEVDTTSNKHEQLVQHYASDWDFILARAQASSMLVFTENNLVRVKKPALESALSLHTNSNNIFEFDATINAKPITKEYSQSAWDHKAQAYQAASSGTHEVDNIGDISTKTLADVFNKNNKQHISDASLTDDELKNLAQGDQDYAYLASKTGTLTCAGFSEPAFGKTFDLGGVSKRFNGQCLCTSVKHEIANGRWTTTIGFGLHAHMTRSPSPPVTSIEYAAIPSVRGLSIGKIKQVHEDPSGDYRVQVNGASFGDTDNLIWARLQQPYASGENGFFFYPEIDDEVVLGFIDDNPNHAIILGSLYSQKVQPNEEVQEGNHHKSITSRTKMAIRFDDDKTIFTACTPGGHKLIMSDEDKNITLVDANNNEVLMDESGISLTSPKTINISADEDINLSAGGNIATKATQDHSSKAMNITQTASASSSTDAATVDVKGSAQITINGAMVMIN